MTKNDKPKELKVTDKRIFTPEGDLREEFRNEIKPAEPMAAKPAPPAEKPAEKKAEKKEPPREERRRTMADKVERPATPFIDFIEPLIAQAYMSLGMLRNPYSPKPQIDPGAARQMIEILGMLKEKTQGNLTEDEDDFLSTHLGDLKLAFVQRTKSI